MSSPTGNGENPERTWHPKDETADLDSMPTPAGWDVAPQRINRYRIERMLGSGGFGCVYLAHDEQLNRRVAIKVPRAAHMASPEAVERYLYEARSLASLDHPNIVPVFDMGRSEQYPCYLVSKFIEGHNLAQRLEQQRLTWAQAAELVMVVAEALQHAHQRGLFHRDIKPANILVDVNAAPHVTDFGLALKEEELGTGPRFIGSPYYMSPEQARGEGHLVDGRTDIFSLGVVLYEILTGHRPFKGDTPQEVLLQVQSLEARPPRQLDDSIPKELERICLKAMAKRASDRYTTARDLADDLRWFLNDANLRESARVGDSSLSQNPMGGLKVVPKGLRSFDANDSDFFLELLPGPRDREGLPEVIRFWKNRIEERDAESTFRVGLVYGPSGCGKSSLVKAGLLPRLSPRIITVYVEASGEDTVERLIRGLRKGRPELPANVSLKDHLAAFRRGNYLARDEKLLLVIDQFEQYLHSRASDTREELVEALRQCDGEIVQCLLLVRDDFWMAMSEFMRELEIRIVEGRNSAPLSLFDSLHARKVLAEFGRAFGRLPIRLGELSPEQESFLDEAVAGLSQSGRVIPVRLSLFAEMVKGRPWTGETLAQLGGMEGVGASFLEESFGATTAPPEHRRHQKATRAVLGALLPDRGTNITGHLRSYGELLDASGYANRPEDFEGLLRILDDEVRLITPVDREVAAGSEEADEEEQAGDHTRRTIVHLKETKRSLRTRRPARYYKLTHDYLVPSLRQWLAHKQRETRSGRAQLRLTDLAAVWNTKPDNRFLPGWWDTVCIWLLTDRRDWARAQQRMMQQASRYYGLRWLGLVVVLALLGLGEWRARRELHQLQQASQQQQASALVDALLFAPADAVPSAIKNLEGFREEAQPLLRSQFHDSSAIESTRIRAAMGLAAFGEVEDHFLADHLGQAPDRDVKNFSAAFSPLFASNPRAADDLYRRGQEEFDVPTKARLAAILLERGDARLASEVLAYGPDPAARNRLVLGLVDWMNGFDALPRVLESRSDPALRSGICEALGAAEPGQLYTEAAQQLLLAVSQLYQNAPHPSVHSSAGQALRAHQMGPAADALRQQKLVIPPALPQPSLPLLLADWHRQNFPDETPDQLTAARREAYDEYRRSFMASVRATVPQPGFDWYVDRWGVTMLKIPPPLNPPSASTAAADSGSAAGSIAAEFYLSDREVPRDLFLAFMNDDLYPAAEKPVDWRSVESSQTDTSVQNVSWVDAVLFCNWLSQRTGRRPCYLRADAPAGADEKAGAGETAPSGDTGAAGAMGAIAAGWRFDPSADGFRLPTEDEWERACRAGTRTRYSFGDDEQWLPNYAVYAANARLPKPGALRLPNAFGCFDVHGNVWEWCHGGDCLRGGAYDLPAAEVTSQAREAAEPTDRKLNYGFRVALNSPAS